MSRDISFATFNLYNLQLPGLDWRSTPYTPDQYAAKIAWSAERLRMLNADVVAFQELWSEQCLHDMIAVADAGGTHRVFTIKEPGEGWYDIAVAAVVRDPWEVREKRLHKSFPDGFVLTKRGGARDPEDNEIHVQVDKFARTVLDLELGHKDHPDLPPVRVLCAHLKSKLATRLDREERDRDEVRLHAAALGAAISTIRRTAEAAALRIVANGLMRDTNVPVVVLGDLNDGAFSNTLGILSEQPSYRLFADSRAGSRSDRGLYAASQLQEYRALRDVGYTHDHKGVKEILDHVLVSEQFYDHSRNRVWSFRDMRIWNDHVDEDGGSSSDHGLVRASFDYNPA